MSRCAAEPTRTRRLPRGHVTLREGGCGCRGIPFIGDRPIRSLKAKVRTLTHRLPQQSLGFVIMRLNQILRGWSSYFKRAVAKNRFAVLQ